MNRLFALVMLAGWGTAAAAGLPHAVAVPTAMAGWTPLFQAPVLACDVMAVAWMGGAAAVVCAAPPIGQMSAVLAVPDGTPGYASMAQCASIRADGGVGEYAVMARIAGSVAGNVPAAPGLAKVTGLVEHVPDLARFGGLSAVGTENLPVAGIVPSVVATGYEGLPVVGTLAGTAMVGSTVPTAGGFGVLTGASLAGLPFYGLAAYVKAVEQRVPVSLGFSATAALSLEAWRQMLPLKMATLQDIDPFLGPVDIWEDGPLGDLKKAAKRAAAAGDEAEYQRLVSAFWQGITAATGRREASRERAEAATRRTGGRRVRSTSGEAGQTQ